MTVPPNQIWRIPVRPLACHGRPRTRIFASASTYTIKMPSSTEKAELYKKSCPGIIPRTGKGFSKIQKHTLFSFCAFFSEFNYDSTLEKGFLYLQVSNSPHYFTLIDTFLAVKLFFYHSENNDTKDTIFSQLVANATISSLIVKNIF